MLRILVIWLPRWKCTSCKQSAMPRCLRYSRASSASVKVRPNLERKPALYAPAAGAARGQLDANADDRAHAQVLGVADDRFQFGEFLDDGNDLLAHLAGQGGHLDELVVLEAVANDGRVVAVGQGEHGEQLGLGPGFQAEVVGFAEIEDLLDDVPLLVDLDGINAAVGALVGVFRDGCLKRLVDFADAVPQDIGEAKQNRQLDAALLELVDQVFEVDGLLGAFVGMNGDMTPVVDAEVAFAPVANLVDFQGVLDFPSIH